MDNLNLKNLAERAIVDDKLLLELLEGLLSKKEEIRYKKFKVLLSLSEKHPEILYPHWTFFIKLLKSDNTYRKFVAIHIITNLTRADKEGKFEKLFNTFFSLLDDKSVIPAAHVAGSSGKIVKAKPSLVAKITTKLLNIDKTHHHQERKDLIKSYAIESFSLYFEETENKEEIIEFVKEQLNSKSQRTRKKAKEFLAKWNK